MPVNKNEVVKKDDKDNGTSISASQPKKHLALRTPVTVGLFVGLVLAGFGGVWLLDWAASIVFEDNLPAFVNFFFQNAINLFVFIAVAFSLILIAHQWLAMRDAVKQAEEQARIASNSLVVSSQSYVGIHSVVTTSSSRGGAILIKIENIGRVPADEIRIEGHISGLLLNQKIVDENVREAFYADFNEHYGRSKLFPGYLKIELLLPCDKYMSGNEYSLMMNGDLQVHIFGKIVYKDDFGEGKITEFSFYHSKEDRWMIAAPWSPDVLKLFEGKKKTYIRKANREQE